MKHLLKKGLSLFLAVLMVVSMLPMDALAVAFLSEDEDTPSRREEAVLDVGDPIVDTLGGGTSRDDDGAAVETPDPGIGDGDDKPVDPLWTNGTVTATINPDGSWEVTMTTSGAGANVTSRDWGLALIPNVNRGAGTVLPSDFATGQNGSNTLTHTGLAGDIRDYTGLRNEDFVIVGGSDLRTGADGSFTVSSADYTNMPSMDYLTGEFTSLTAPIDVVVIFFTKGSDGVESHVKTTTTTYGEVTVAAGLPSTTYVLDKSANTLTYVSGTLGGRPWTNPNVADGVDANASWSEGSSRLVVPVYSTYSTDTFPDGVAVSVPGPTPAVPNVSGGTVTDRAIVGVGNVPSTMTVEATSGTITLPVTAYEVDESGNADHSSTVATATITIYIISGAGITLAPITFDVDYGFDSELTSEDISVIAAHNAARTLKWAAVYFNLATGTNPANWTYPDVNGTSASSLVKPAVNKTGVYWISTNATSGSRPLLALNPDNKTDVSATPTANRISGEGSVHLKLQPNNDVWTLTGAAGSTTDYKFELTLPALAARPKNAATGAVVTNGSTTPHAKLPITVTVHGGYAVFHHKDGSTTTVAGIPSETVAAANTVGGVGVPSGSWARNSTDTTPLAASQIVLGGRDAIRHYYEIELVTGYDVTYHLSSGEAWNDGGVSTKHDVVDQTSHTVTSEKVTKANYAFKGWATSSTAATAGTVTYKGGESLTLTADVNLYPVWAPVYTVTYQNSSTTGHPSVTVPTDTSSPYETGSNVTVLGVAGLSVGDEKDGTDGKVYKFLGWDMGGAKYYPGETNTSFTITADSTLTAAWEEVTYTVKYDMNGVTVSNASSFTDEAGLSNGAETTKASGEPLATGKTFTGWKVGTSKTVAKGAQYTVDKADATNHVITLVAQWSDNDYTVIFDPNNGAWSDSASGTKTTSGKYADKVTAPTETVSRTGYTFKGWNTKDDGSGDDLDTTSDTYGAKTGTTYYAKWEEDAAKVTFHTQSGTWASDFGGTGVQGTTNDYVVDGHYHDTLTVPTTANISREGYTFQGWATSNSSTTTVTVKTKLGEAAADSADYYAVWTVNKYTLSYNMNGHGTNPGSSQHDYNESVTLSASPAVGDKVTESGIHWVFGGWYNEAALTNQVTAITMPAADKTVYAKWTKDTHTLTYDDNVASETIAVPTTVTGVECGTATAVDTTALSRTGYTFLGWSTNKSATTATYAAGAASQTITLTSDTTLYAIWKINTYTVTYDKGDHGGSDVPAAQTGNYNTTVTLTGTMSDSTESNIHWIFKGWSTVKNDATTKVTKFDNISANHTVYALWEKDKHTLTYNANGGTASSVPTTVTGVECGTATAVAVNATPTWDASHRFLGWDTNSKATTPTYPKGVAANITLTSDTTLYAIWESVVTVTWKTGGGTWSTAQGGGNADKTQTDKSGSAMTTYVGGTDVTRAGYRFKSWTNNPGTTMPNADTTYTAQWDRLYNVVFDLNAPAGATDITVNPTSVAKVTDKIVGEKATSLAALSDTQGNYVFKGWALSANGNAAYAAGGDYTVVAAHANGDDGDNAKITLYGVWVKKTNVTYNTGSGAFADSATSWTDKGDPTDNTDTYTVPADPTRSGYDFAGWQKTGASSVDTGKVAGSTHTFPATDETYTAQWKVKQYKVTFVWNTTAHGHTATEKYAETSGDFGAAISKPTTDPGMVGYTFGGWYKEAACTNALTGTDTYPANDSMVVYAKWTANEYIITYADPQNGAASGMPDPLAQKGNYDSTHTLAAAPTGKTGYVWDGWYDGATKVTADFTITGNRTLNAKWQITVSFDIHDPATPSTLTDPTDQVIAAGGTVTLPTQADLTDYQFLGWFAAATGGTALTGAEPYSTPVTLHAQWKAKEYTYTFDPNGGAFPTGTVDTSTKGGVGAAIPGPNNGAATPAKVDPVWKDHTFKGWNATKADASAGTADTNLPDATMPSGGKTIYAAWTENTYKYNFDANKGTWGGTPEVTVQTKTGKAGATVDAPDSAPTYTDADGRNYRFDGWSTVKDDPSKKITTFTITGNANDGDVTDTVYALWTPLYTITYDPGTDFTATIVQPTNPSQTDVPVGRYNAAAPYTNTTAGAYISATGGSWDGTVRFNTADGKHWKFEGWTPDGGTTKINAGGNVTISNADITLTAVWTQEYKVTMKDGVRLDESTSAGNAGGKLNGSSSITWSHATPPYIYVSSAFGVADAQLLNNNSDHVFVKWMATNTGAFTNGTAADKTQSTNVSDTFTPTADTELTPVFAKKPGLTPAVDGYQLNFATGAAVPAAKWQPSVTPITKANNTLPAYTWDKGDATIGDVTIQKAGDTSATTLTEGTHYTYNSTTGVIEFQRAYLLTLEATKSYTVTVKSTTNGVNTDKTATLWAVVTPDDLLRVEIGVKPDTAADYEADPVVNATPAANRTKSASVTVEARNQVKYLDHAETTIIPSNLLTYQWYYAPGPSTPNRHTAVGNLTLPAGAVAIGTSTTDNFVDMNNNNYKGKYIFATVVATGTGKDAVVTNSIPVDYDAVILVNKDGAAIPAATKDNYKVYLVPSTVSTPNFVGDLAAQGIVEAKYQSANQYKTDESALTGGVSYNVYANKVEGDSSVFVDTTLDVTTQINADATSKPTVNFYSVNAVNTNLLHKQDANNEYVGESFGVDNADAPTVEFYAEGVTAKFDSGKGVLTGTKVTAKASKTWTQDYDVNWGMKEDAATTAPTLPYGKDNQVAADAKNTGKDYANIDAKTWIGAQLEQNVYTVTGNVWINDPGKTSNAGIVALGNDVPTLEYKNDTTGKTYLFKATVNSNGVHKSTVTFAGVPRSGVANAAIDGKYVVTATAKSSNTKSTIKKYIPGQNVATATDTSIAGVTALTDQTLAADVNATNVAGPMFTVVLEASTYTLKAADTETAPKSAQHTYDASATKPGAPNAAPRLAIQPWTGTYAGITAKTYTINVTNEGNMPLDVTLNIKRTLGTDNVYVYGPDKAGTDDLTASGSVWTDSDNNVTFGDLQETFSLAPKGDTGDKVTFTVTVPADLAVNSAADYAFELTSMEKDSTTLYGPSVTYKLTQKVTPLKITDIQVKSAGTNAWQPDALAIDSSTTIPTGVDQSAEVEYKWYVAPTTSSNVALNKTGTGTLTGTGLRPATALGVSGNTYTLTAADQGMSLYLVAHNKDTGNIIEADFVKVADLPYDLEIQVNEDSNPTANKGNYTVYLWPTTGGTFDKSDAKAIPATATAATDGRYKATGLVPGTTYDIYTNAVGGTADHYQKSGTQASLTDFTGKNVPIVTYRSVTINNTTTDNSPYSFADSTDPFLKDADGTTTTLDGTLKKPTAILKGATTKVADPDAAASKWVQAGTEITVTYPAWNKDYTLSWDVGSDVTNAAANATGDVTVNVSTTIDSELTLNVYKVTLTVDGPGTLSEVKMNDGTRDFTATAGNFHATGATVPPIGKGSYTFTVPKGTYTVEGTGGTGTDILYYKIPAGSSDTITPGDIASKNVSVSDDTSSFHIQLNSVGQYMLVEDDQKPVDNAAITAHASGTAGWTGTTKTDGTASSTIHLPYGYTAAKTVTVTVANNSAENNHLYDLTWTPAATGNSASITAAYTALDGSNNLMYPYGGTVDSPLTATLTVGTGLGVGTHTYTADVSFSTADGGDTKPTVTYTLTVVVDATKFTNVTVVDEDNANVTDVALGKDLKFSTYTTATVDDWTAKTLVADTDYTYQWYHGPANKTATESWNASTGNVVVTDATAISGATSATLDASEIAKYPGEHIYLVISAVKDKNVIEAAISAPITTGFQPVVKVAVDGVDQSTVTDFDGTGYTATIDDGITTWNTVWDDTAKGFVPVNNTTDKVKVSLDATKEYTAKVSRVQGDGTNLVALSDKLKNTTTGNTVTAEYFTVNTVETKAFEGITGLGEEFGGTDKLTGPAVSLALADNTALVTGTPVLKGQGVVAKAANWTQDYELTWYTRMDGAATVPTRDTAYEGTTPTMTAQGGKVDVTSATGTGYTVNQVTNKLYVGGRLDQITYTVVGTVAGTGTVGQVALKQTAPKSANYIYPDTTTPPTSPVKPTSTASVTNGPLAKDETVTFTVVKGTFTITPTEGANTVIKKVSWEGVDEAAGVTVLKDKTVQLKGTAPKRTYNFVVTVEGADIKLKVSDDVAAPNTTAAESNPNAWNDDTNAVERYFNYIHFQKANSANGDVYEYALTLTNAGNKDVLVNAEVYRFDTTPATGFGVNATKWEATKAKGTLVYETKDGAAKALVGASGKTVLSLSDMLDANTKVTAKSAAGVDGTAEAGKITLGTAAWAKDSGAYVFHFMGVTNDADKVPVDVYYVLDLTVDQLPIVGVATNNDGSTMPGVGDTLTVKGYDADVTKDKSLENVTVKTSDKPDQTNAAAANLTGNDVHFAWVKMAAGAALAKTDLSVVGTGANAGTLASAKGTVVSQGKTYTLVDGDQDSDFYLVAFAPNYTGNVTNATDMVIANVVKAKRTAGVKVSLNGYPVTGTTDPGYEVYLVESGKTFDADHTDGSTGTWATAWNTTTNRYEAAIDVENKTYEVYAVTYKDGATILKAINGTLGKQTSGTKTEETVPYWNVTFTEDVAVTSTRDGFKSYLPNGAAGTTNAIQESLSVKVSTTKGGTTYETDALTASTTSTATTVPVLEGMNVQVTVDATKSSKNTTDGVKKSWSESDVQSLHTLTATGWTNSADNKGSGIGYADSIVSNAVLVSTSAKTFSAKLDQVLFDVTFTVKDISEDADGNPAPSAKTKVRQVTLIPDGGQGETGSYSPVSTVGTYGNGDAVSISGVPAGSFEVKAATVPGTPTLVKGYTWNATGDDLNTPITPGKIVVVVGGADADDTNKHAGNTIQTIEATKVVNWSDTFDEATGGVLADKAFNPSNGFVKADNTTATPKKLFGLTEGYTAAGGAVLEYTVRVANGGTDDMTGFYLTRSGDGDMTYDLTDVTWHKADGSKEEHHNATTKFTLGPGDYLEFPIAIPEGKVAKRDNYKTEITPHCDLNAGETLGGGNYAPEYQVKSPVKFNPGQALVLYGGSDFESNTDIALDWPATTDETKPTFTYEVLALDGTNDAAILKEINDALGLSLTTLDAKPTWLTHDNTTGAITMPAGAHADTVNVKVKGTPADFDAYDQDANGHKVNNEVTLYLRATDDKTALTYVIPYVVDVEPGQLDIDDSADFAPANPVGGQSVNKNEFTYLKVANQADAPLDVVPALDAGAKRTGAGNDPVPANAGNGKVFVNDVHTATWTVDPVSYVSDVSTDYVFTVTYKPENAVEKWNYKPDTYTKTLTANKPPLGLTFGDVLGVSSIEPANAELKLGRAPDVGYSDIKTDNQPYAPAAMEDTDETYRKGEFITYLDTEPKYTVTITATGDLHDVKVEQELAGFKVVKGDLSFTTMKDGDKKTFELELSPVSGNKWVGKHTAKFTVTGKGASGDSTSATYEVELTMTPKVIAEAHVTDLTDPTPGAKPDTTVTVDAKDPEGEDIKPTTPDKHGNTPIKPEVTWTDPQGNPVDPTKPFEDDKDYKVTVDLPADPNYTFEDLTDPAEEPNYTLNGKTDVNDDPTLVDKDLTITVTSEDDPPVPDRNKQVTFEKTTELPKFAHLEFEDVNAGNAADKMPHAVNVTRPTITVKRGDALGKYIISLGAYDNAVTTVKLSETANTLPTGAVWSLTPDTIDRLDDVTATPAGDKQSYTLDLSGVYTVNLDAKTYTLELKAEGKDVNYPDRSVTPATYKITVQVLPADPSKLMFKDLLKEGTGAGTENVITPAENVYAETYTREITVKWDKASGWWYPLGTYDIDLGASINNVRDLELNSRATIASDSIARDLSTAIREFNNNVGKLDKGDVWSFALDLSDVDYHTLNTDATAPEDLEYLELTATGKDLNGATVKATYKLTLKFEVPPKPELKFDDVKQGGATSDPATTGPEVNDTRSVTATVGTKLGKYTIYLGAYDAGVKVTSITSTRSPNLVYDVTPDCATITPVTLVERKSVGDAQAFVLDLTGMDTSKSGTYTLTLVAQGVDLSGKYTVNASYTLTIRINEKGGGGGGGGGSSCPNQVTYLLGLYGTTKDATMEMVSGNSVKSVPNVSALEGYKFLGWSLTGPSGKIEQDAKRTLVDPKSVTINGDTTFYAVYQMLYKVPQPPFHKHYVIGYPNGNFGPADNIDRASVATIIARAVLPNFVEGADYGNPGGYSDVNGHWAASAIAYCSKYGVFKGYDDGTFKPGQPISRQELALVMARIGGIKKGSAPFSDISDAGDWAKDGIYTAYANGWVNGYTDGTFKPLNPIRRDETVKIFNAYLGRGVDAEGLSALTEYVHSGVASNVTENGTSEYMTWPDVTKDQWAYYEIIEAANDHEFEVDATQPRGYAVPEQWTKCWIDERWRYHDDANDGGPNAVVSALTRKFGAAD